MLHPLWFTVLGLFCGVGVTVVYGGLGMAGVVQRRLGWGMAIFGMVLTLGSLCGLVWLLWDAGLALLRTVPEFWLGASVGGFLMLILGCFAVGWLLLRLRRFQESLKLRHREALATLEDATKTTEDLRHPLDRERSQEFQRAITGAAIKFESLLANYLLALNASNDQGIQRSYEELKIAINIMVIQAIDLAPAERQSEYIKLLENSLRDLQQSREPDGLSIDIIRSVVGALFRARGRP